jgi:hypothetical protein
MQPDDLDVSRRERCHMHGDADEMRVYLARLV